MFSLFYELDRVTFSCPDRGTKRCPSLKTCPGVTKRCPDWGTKACPGVTKRCFDRGTKTCPGVAKRCPDRATKMGHVFVPRSGHVWFPVPMDLNQTKEPWTPLRRWNNCGSWFQFQRRCQSLLTWFQPDCSAWLIHYRCKYRCSHFADKFLLRSATYFRWTLPRYSSYRCSATQWRHIQDYAIASRGVSSCQPWARDRPLTLMMISLLNLWILPCLTQNP